MSFKFPFFAWASMQSLPSFPFPSRSKIRLFGEKCSSKEIPFCWWPQL
jgi:hypothetical protein